VPKWVEAVTARYQGTSTKFVCVGYCFGAPYVCDELAMKTVVAGAFAHPAFLKEHHFRNIESKFWGCKIESRSRADLLVEPLFMSCSEVDHTFDAPSRRMALDILQKEKKTYHYQLFSGVEHGFALRGNPDDPYQRKPSVRSIVDATC
jgi:dienelactone hydrolase